MTEGAHDDEVHLRDGGRGELHRQGDLRGGDRAHPQEPGAHGRGAEARPVPERRPGDDVAVPARRGVRDARRLRDGPGPRPLRAVHRHRADAQLQHHGGAGVHAAARRGASRRPPGRDDPDGAARDERDQGVHAAGTAEARSGGPGATLTPSPSPRGRGGQSLPTPAQAGGEVPASAGTTDSAPHSAPPLDSSLRWNDGGGAGTTAHAATTGAGGEVPASAGTSAGFQPEGALPAAVPSPPGLQGPTLPL